MMGPSAEETDSHIALACLFFGLFLLLFGLLSLWIRGRLFLTSSVIAMTFGILLGPKVLDIVPVIPGGWDEGTESDKAKEVLLWFTRLVIGIQVLSAGVTLPSKFITRRPVWRSLVILLGPVMMFAVAFTALIVKGIFRIGWWESVLIGACLAPTDPILASAIVKGTFAEDHVPSYIRRLILVESGINDGAGTPYFLIPLLALTKPGKEAVKEYFLKGLLWELLFPIVAASLLGWVASKALEISKKRKWVDKESSLVYTIALAFLTVGLFTYIDSNELLACFFVGTAMNWNDSVHTEDLHTHFSEGIDNLLDVSVFLTLGTVLPWDAWTGAHPIFPLAKLVGFGAAVVVGRRLPAVLLLQKFIPLVQTGKEAMFLGHFGPMGIGAIYYALKAAEELPKDNVLKQALFGVISWMVFTSTIVHGVTVPTFLLGSVIHPGLHPKFLVKAGGVDGIEGTSSKLDPLWRLLSKMGIVTLEDDLEEDDQAVRSDIDDDEGGQGGRGESERQPLLRGRSATRKASKSEPTGKGRPITRQELHRVMNDMADEIPDTGEERQNTRRGGQGQLNARQKEALLGQGSGLEDLEEWDLNNKISIYDEGDVCIITDEVNIATRKIVNRKKRPEGHGQATNA